MALLDAILDGLGAHDASLRALCAGAAAEFLAWSAKHIVARDAAKNSDPAHNLNAASLFKRLFDRLSHKQPYDRFACFLHVLLLCEGSSGKDHSHKRKLINVDAIGPPNKQGTCVLGRRLGAASALARISRLKRLAAQEPELCADFLLQALGQCVLALRAAEGDPAGMGTKAQIKAALGVRLMPAGLPASHGSDVVNKQAAQVVMAMGETTATAWFRICLFHVLAIADGLYRQYNLDGCVA